MAKKDDDKPRIENFSCRLSLECSNLVKMFPSNNPNGIRGKECTRLDLNGNSKTNIQ